MSDDYAPLPVSLCDSGTFVSEAQTGLVTWGSPIDADGYFGLVTETAVREFQSESELDPSGVIDDLTWVALCPFTDNLCEPDGGDPDPPTAPQGITIDGQQQEIIYECTHYPFQSVDGVADAHVQAELYLVDDLATGARRVVEIWVEDGNRLLVVASLSEASVSVCQAEGYTVATLNTWWDASGGHAYSELSYSFEAGPPSVQFRNAGTYEQLTSAEISRSTKTGTSLPHSTMTGSPGRRHSASASIPSVGTNASAVRSPTEMRGVRWREDER